MIHVIAIFIIAYKRGRSRLRCGYVQREQEYNEKHGYHQYPIHPFYLCLHMNSLLNGSAPLFIQTASFLFEL